jgi:hypothetical protein
MSTEMMNQCGKCLESELAEIIQDDCLDIVDGEKITAFDFANYVIYLSKVLRSYPIVEDEYKGMKIKVRNCLNGSVSVSIDDCTGLSETFHKPFPTDDDDVFGAWLNLAQMINEAWFLCRIPEGTIIH